MLISTLAEIEKEIESKIGIEALMLM